MLDYIADQIKVSPRFLKDYANREQTRREHLAELQFYLCLYPFGRAEHRAIAKIATEVANGTDRGEAIVRAMIEHLRASRVILPSASVFERIGLAARARARQRTYVGLARNLSATQKEALLKLLVSDEHTGRTTLAWLREWPEAPARNNIVKVIERLDVVRGLNIEKERERRIHQARYTAISNESMIMGTQHISLLEANRRLATLVVFSRNMEAILTDAALTMFDKLIGIIARKAERLYSERVTNRAKILDKTIRTLAVAGRAVMTACAAGNDTMSAIEKATGWVKFVAAVTDTENMLSEAGDDNGLTEIVTRYTLIRKAVPTFLNAFRFCSWQKNDPLLAALDILRDLYSTGKRNLPPHAPVRFLRKQWLEFVGSGKNIERNAYEIAVLLHLRDRLRAGDIWVEGSRAFRAFDDFLLSPTVFAAMCSENVAGLAVPENFQVWLEERNAVLSQRLTEVASQAAAGELPEARITEEGLSISPIKRILSEDAELLSRRLYNILPRIRITELLAEVHNWTGFADRFTHLRSGQATTELTVLMSAILADGTNLGLSRMAESAKGLTHAKLLWNAEWHIRNETYTASLAVLTDAIHAHSFTGLWGAGDTSSSDGQFFKAGGHGEGRSDTNAKYGRDPGVKFYTHISDKFAPFHIKVISATVSEAAYVLDGLMQHESSIKIREHSTDTAGATEHVFALCHLLGFRFSPRIRDLKDRKLYVLENNKNYGLLESMIAGQVDQKAIAENWNEILRLAASIKTGTVSPSVILKKLGSYPRQNALAKALREIGRIDRSIFTLNWISDPALRRHSHAGQNKGEARNSLARAVFFNRLGELRDRTFENQQYRASGLNLIIAAITLWNTAYLARAVDQLRAEGNIIPDKLLASLSPLGWEHIILTGDYIWPSPGSVTADFRPFREARSPFLMVA